MLALCDKLLEMPSSDRLRLGEKAREGVLAYHTQYHRCKEMVEIVRSIRDARLLGRRAPQPDLSFLSISCVAGAAPDAILGWEG
jgi:hypothetical protein